MHSVIVEGSSDDHQGQSYYMQVMKMGRVCKTWSTLGIHQWQLSSTLDTGLPREEHRHQSPSGALTKQTSVAFLMINIHTCTWTMAHIRQNSNYGHSDDNNTDKTHTQQDSAQINNPNMPGLEDNTGTNNVNVCHKVSMIMDQKNSRPGQVSHRPQRLGTVEEQ